MANHFSFFFFKFCIKDMLSIVFLWQHDARGCIIHGECRQTIYLGSTLTIVMVTEAHIVTWVVVMATASFWDPCLSCFEIMDTVQFCTLLTAFTHYSLGTCQVWTAEQLAHQSIPSTHAPITRVSRNWFSLWVGMTINNASCGISFCNWRWGG